MSLPGPKRTFVDDISCHLPALMPHWVIDGVLFCRSGICGGASSPDYSAARYFGGPLLHDRNKRPKTTPLDSYTRAWPRARPKNSGHVVRRSNGGISRIRSSSSHESYWWRRNLARSDGGRTRQAQG